jgi:hypothetical protein
VLMDIHKDCYSAIDLPDKTVPTGGRRFAHRCNEALPRKYKSIELGCSNRSARPASAAMSCAFSEWASRDTISSCIAKRSATDLPKRSAYR